MPGLRASNTVVQDREDQVVVHGPGRQEFAGAYKCIGRVVGLMYRDGHRAIVAANPTGAHVYFARA